ncbi:MAG TPA: hypothetical protein VFP94_00460 [Terriglobales bacterium]|nr:hypothetical protein [Terriglobales bacterium]
MRSMACVLSLLACLLLGAGAAAQSSINLLGLPGQTVTFSGMGAGTSSLAMTLGSGNCFDGACTLFGLGEGNGNLSSTGVVMMKTTSGSIQMDAGSSDSFSLQSSAPIEFPYYGINAATGQMGLLLDGDLNLTDFTLGGSNPTSASAVGYLTLTGGSLAPAPGSTLLLNLDVYLPSWNSLANLVGTGNSLSARLADGRLSELSAAPEPAGWMLAVLGALVLGGGYIRRRLRLGVLA